MLRKCKQWWQSPDHELLRYEWAWFWRFLFSWRGLILILVQLALFVVTSIFERFYGVAALHIFSPVHAMYNLYLWWGGENTPIFMIQNVPWIYLFHRRVIRRLQEPMRSELKVAPINGKMLWPAFLITPLLWGILFSLMYYFSAIIRMDSLLFVTPELMRFSLFFMMLTLLIAFLMYKKPSYLWLLVGFFTVYFLHDIFDYYFGYFSSTYQLYPYIGYYTCDDIIYFIVGAFALSFLRSKRAWSKF